MSDDRVPLTPDLVGRELGPYEVAWDRDDVILYALGIGARPDAAGLPFLYEGHGPRVFPTYGVIPTMCFVDPLMETVDATWDRAVHGAQRLEIVREELPAEAAARTSARILEVWDKGTAAVFVVEAETSDDRGPLFRVRATLFVPGSGGFGGERGPARVTDDAQRDRPPDDEIVLETRPEQAAIYRLSGDRNPLHIDPDVAVRVGFERPILHGLCTFGFVARAVVAGACDADARRLAAMDGRFTRPVYPGDPIRTLIWEDGDTIRLEARDPDGKVTFADGTVELRAPSQPR